MQFTVNVIVFIVVVTSSWFCHLDDDIYIVLKNLVKLLSKFDPLKEPIYMGRAGTHWKKPFKVTGIIYTLIIVY